MRTLVTDPVIENILSKGVISSETECDVATYYVERCFDVFNLEKTNPFRQKVSKVLELIQKFSVESRTK